MFGLRAAIAIAASIAILLTILITLIVRRCNNFSKRGTNVTTEATTTTTTPPPLPPPQYRGKTELRQSQRISKIEPRPRSNHPVFRRGPSAKPRFNWSDHPSLISDAVENGWSRFAFTPHVSSQPSRSTLLGCVGDHLHHHHNQQNYRDAQVEIAWEVRENSLDFMQKIRLNSGLKKFSSSNSSSSSMKSVIRTALPLPGPPLGSTSSFPEEAYFEITILSVSSSSSSSRNDKNNVEGEKTKLIQDKGLEQKRKSESIIKIATSKSINHSWEEGERTGLMMSVGLTSSSHVPLKIPGSYPASIGFNSDGSVYLDGIKMAYGSRKEIWGQHKIMGCGFNPKQKKVFFTTDSVLTHMINCKSDEFGSPLYPIIAANADITILVNMGQTRFSYEPANSTRTPNPCFIGSILSTPTCNEDSEELFSMGRVDSGWLNHSTTKSTSTNSDVYSWCNGAYNSNSSNNGEFKSKLNEEEDDESEADLFEIVLDTNGRSLQV